MLLVHAARVFTHTHTRMHAHTCHTHTVYHSADKTQTRLGGKRQIHRLPASDTQTHIHHRKRLCPLLT